MPLNQAQLQLTLLRSAVERGDGLLTCPEGLSTRYTRALAAKLIRSEFAEQVTVGAGQPSWGEEAGGRVGLRLTPAGLAESGAKALEPATSSVAGEAPPAAAQPQVQPQTRSGTKQALVLALLRRGQGATLDDLTGATGWLAHSTRAALTGLRRKGYSLTRDRNTHGQTTYRLAAESAADASPELPASQNKADEA